MRSKLSAEMYSDSASASINPLLAVQRDMAHIDFLRTENTTSEIYIN